MAGIRKRRCGAHLVRWRPAMMSLALLLVTGCVAERVAAATSNTEPGKTFLWSVASPTAAVHLLGSIHVGSPDTYPLDPRIEAAFERSQVLLLETSMDATAQMEAALKLTRAGTYPAGETIDLHLDRETLELLQAHLKKVGASFASVRSFRPWLLATVLIVGEMQRLGYQPALGIDRYFAQKAKDRKQIVALETLDEQVALFGGMPRSVQESMLKETLTRMKDLPEQMKRVFALWQSGDAMALDQFLLVPMRRDYPDLFKRLFLDRNRKMAAAIDGYLGKRGDHFVVVGSGHLIGPDGILDLLRRKGYVPVQR